MSWNLAWENVFKERDGAQYPSESLIRFIAKNFYQKDRKDIAILEAGCGAGPNIWYMAREGFDVYGIDGSITAIEKAKKRLLQDRLKADLKEGDITDLPYKDNYFDAVIDSECLYSNSADDALRALKEIRRVLKDGGLFYSRTFTDETTLGRFYRKISDKEYADILEGALAGNALARLANKDDIKELYGSIFKLLSIDRSEYTLNNEGIKVSEWVIICKKES